jgi:hypothetical protein
MCNLRNKNGEYKAKHFLQFSSLFVSFEVKKTCFALKIGGNRLILEGFFSPNLRSRVYGRTAQAIPSGLPPTFNCPVTASDFRSMMAT